MRCKNCNYRLWNLTSRRCPECGTKFRPSEFEFVPSSVRFCCPHCGQDYYGTGDKGHLDPAGFDCVRCGVPVQMDEMVLLPTEGVDEDQTGVEIVPWLARKKRGVLSAWFSMLGRGMVSPGRLMRTVPVVSSTGQAWWFATFTGFVIVLLGALPFTIIGFVAGGLGPPGSWVGFGAGFGVVLLVLMAIALVFVLLWGLTVHALLRLTGRPSGTIGRTYQAICYSFGPNIVSATPCIGPHLTVVGGTWWVVSSVLAVKEAQRVGGGRAALAVLPLPLLIVGSIIGLYLWFIYSVFSGVGLMAWNMPSDPTGETRTVLEAVLDYADQNGGRGPDHAIQLVVGDSFMTTTLFIASDSATTEKDVPIANMTLARFARLSGEREKRAVEAAVDALPDKTIAHRVGDFVFTHHGIDTKSADASLWLVIESFDPDTNPTGRSGGQPYDPNSNAAARTQNINVLTVGDAYGNVAMIWPDLFPARLAKQNRLRAKYNLPPLPDPSRVKHDNPAVAP